MGKKHNLPSPIEKCLGSFRQMRLSPINDVDVLSGLIFAGLGAGVVYVSASYDFGTVARMGPGFFPRVLGVLLTGLGIVIAARGFMKPRAKLTIERLRPIFAIGGSLIAFGWILPRLGFVPALIASCLLAMAAIQRSSLKEMVFLPLLLCVFCSLVFIYGLGLAIPLAKW
ncbi:MAG: tripartite tricarboxylate transporter TctB family protein [Afipia sp.]|jgi:hypothetical protein|nr:tripartite tricarboxylate transporter TctB family protein [Afipia sp.]